MSGAQHHDGDPGDPAPPRPGAPAHADRGARLSQNEIGQLCLKAARGAGMSWGLAEEAGFAAAWMAARGLDGPGALLAQLRGAMGRPWHAICPVVAPGAFRAGDGGDGAGVCPIALGAALCDHARLPQTAMDPTALHIGPVNRPVLLLGFVSQLACTRGSAVRLTWARGRVLLATDGRVFGDVDQLAHETRCNAELCVAGIVPEGPPPRCAPLSVSAQTLSGLETFAMRTTVPASEASRAGAGAGAAAGDND